ncbi:MAG TPA: elongation factor G [Solirubrobacteraceae bacterium]|nr:elongation factor G [Solirubrobacteraceae bacterium]
MPSAPDKIRNVAIVGHRGAGKTSLHEALLYEAGVISRMGTVADGTTVSDSDEDERERAMSIATCASTFSWEGRTINLLDTPGEPSFVADALSALHVCEAAIFVVNAVVGVEVQTVRLWERARELDLACLLYVNMLDRERADFFAVLEQLKASFGPHVVATEVPLEGEGEIAGVIDLVDMCALRQQGPARGAVAQEEIPPAQMERAQEYREKLMDEVSELSDALMERYLEGEQIEHAEIVAALKEGTNHGSLFPCVCGAATRNLGTGRLLGAIVEDLPSPVKHGELAIGARKLAPQPGAPLHAYVFKTRADAYAGRVNLLRVFQGTLRHDTQVYNSRTHGRERIGQIVRFAGAGVEHVGELSAGEIGAVAKLKETHAGDWLLAQDGELRALSLRAPAPVMAFAVSPKSHGDEEKMLSSLRRLQEEDPLIDLHRDPQTGEQIVGGLSQVHVEVLLERLRRRFGVEVECKPPRVPYRETIRRSASGHGRHKKQSGGRGQFGDCRIEIEPTDAEAELEFIDQIKGGVIPASFIPAVEKGVREAMSAGVLAGAPVRGVRVRLVDGAYHSVDSSELAFKLAGVAAMREALRAADPVLLEPVMLVRVSVPEECVGDVIGDLSSRRGRPQGMAPAGGLTEIRAEVPMAELLSYAGELRSITGGRGDYTLELLRYEEVPAQIAARVIEAAGAPSEAAHV